MIFVMFLVSTYTLFEFVENQTAKMTKFEPHPSNTSIEDGEHNRDMAVRPSCINNLFSIKKMIWVIKEVGETWNG